MSLKLALDEKNETFLDEAKNVLCQMVMFFSFKKPAKLSIHFHRFDVSYTIRYILHGICNVLRAFPNHRF